MPLIASALLTVSEVRTHLHVTDTTKYPDATVEWHVNAATSAVERYCSRVLVSTTYTNLLLNGTGDQELLAPQWPVSSLSALSFLTGIMPLTWEDVLATDGADCFAIEPQVGRIIHLRTRPFPRGPLNVKATFTAGYLFSVLPVDVKQSAMDFVQIMLRTSDKHHAGVRSYQLQQDTTELLIAEAPPDTLARLRPYRRVA